jgi:hypothetical protein
MKTYQIYQRCDTIMELYLLQRKRREYRSTLFSRDYTNGVRWKSLNVLGAKKQAK